MLAPLPRRAISKREAFECVCSRSYNRWRRLINEAPLPLAPPPLWFLSVGINCPGYYFINRLPEKKHWASPVWLFPENKSVYVQKIKAYVQKIKAFVSCLHMMEFGIYKEKMKNSVFTKNWDMTDFYKSKLSFWWKHKMISRSIWTFP